jgi:hypothetical protein
MRMELTGIRLSLLTAATVFLLAAPWSPAKSMKAPDGAIKPDDLLIVDCLLPGQVRQLGEGFTYLAARRPARLSAHDCAIRGGEYVAFDRANLATALKVWMPKAKEGDADAMNYVGEIFEKGLGGVTPDFTAAADWYQKAADKGNSSAMINLGSLYEGGRGVKQDSVQALNWYRKASGLKGADLELVTDQDRAKRQQDAEELEKLRAQAIKLKADLDNARTALIVKQGELKQANSELASARKQANALARESAEGKRAAAKVAELEAQIAANQRDIGSINNAHDTALAGLAAPVAMTTDGKPIIQVIAPKLCTTRGGILTAPLLVAAPTTYGLIGRVQPVSDLKALKVNDQDIAGKVDSDGLFQMDLNVGKNDTPVRIQAISKSGKVSEENFVISALNGEDTVAKRVTTKLFQNRMRSDLGRFHALVIGNNDYSHFGKLQTAVADANAIADVLKSRYGYETKVLTNATREQVLAALAGYTNSLKKEDNLLIYYAGHGQIDAAGEGYWVPTDGVERDSKTWLSNKVISDFIGASAAKHILVVADSCYSGTLSGSAIQPLPLTAKEQDILFISRVKARVALTSGGLEPVLDSDGGAHSIFASAFLRALNDNDGLNEAYRLTEAIKQQVQIRSTMAGQKQIPRYTALKYAGHEGSEYFFLPKAS